MSENTVLKQNITPVWCTGCGLFTIQKVVADTMEKLNWNKTNTVVISGIGCSGRSSAYFDTDALHTTHGRAIPVAEGIKLVRPELNVLIISGDGDLLSIGLSHLAHIARRNTNIKVICNRNEVFAMTGGQAAPTTQYKDKTRTTPLGIEILPINVKPIITANNSHFYARTSITDIKHMQDSIFASFLWEGFSFVEVISLCHTNRARYSAVKNTGQMLLELRQRINESEDKLEVVYKK